MPRCLWQFRQLGGRATQPCDGGLGNSLRTPAAREQLFKDVESWKPRLIVTYLPDWTPGVSELSLELVRRQRAGGREILLNYPLHTSMPLPLGHVKAGLHLVYGTLDGRAADTPQETTRFWLATAMTVLAVRLSECVQQEANVSEALVSFLNLDGRSGDDIKNPSCVHVADRTSEPALTRMGISFDDTKLDPETSSRESWTCHQRRSDQVPGRRRRHSCQTISHPDRRRTLRWMVDAWKQTLVARGS